VASRNRLSTLHARDILDRFRLYQRLGSQAWRWTLGPVGAAIIAAGRGDPSPRPSAVRDVTMRLAMSGTLAHLVTVNGFFVALTGHARAHPGVRLVRWWNEARLPPGVRQVAQAKRLGHRLPGIRGIYSHVSAVVEQRLVDGLQTRWEQTCSPTSQ
jgi:hypothetical protein